MKKSFGQHLLFDKNYLNKIIKSLHLSQDDTILEIGSGTGLLTIELARIAKRVFAVEPEKKILSTLKENLKLNDVRNVRLIESDFLKLNLLDLQKKEIKVIGNIPYNITSKIIIKLLGEVDVPAPHINLLKNIYLMLQLEVAKRIVAIPFTKSYSPLSLLVQYFCKPEILFKVPASAFYPKPKVDSAFVALNNKKNLEAIDNPAFLKQIIRTSFRERRKKIINPLSTLVNDKLHIMKVFNENDLDCNLRADQISFEQYVKISNLLSK